MSADQRSEPPVSESERHRLLADLHELVEALDRRAPRPERASERAIAGDAAALKEDARVRIAQLQTRPRRGTS